MDSCLMADHPDASQLIFRTCSFKPDCRDAAAFLDEAWSAASQLVGGPGAGGYATQGIPTEAADAICRGARQPCDRLRNPAAARDRNRLAHNQRHREERASRGQPWGGQSRSFTSIGLKPQRASAGGLGPLGRRPTQTYPWTAPRVAAGARGLESRHIRSDLN